MLDDIPIRLALCFTKTEHRLPVNLVFADNRLRAAPIRLDMDGSYSSGVFVQHGHRVSAPIHTIARVELHDDRGFGVAKENVPRGLAVELLKVVGMSVITDRHAMNLDLVRYIIEQ